MPQQTKSDLQEIIDNLDRRIVYYGKEQERHAREKARLSRIFIDLYEENHTLDLRFSWLREAAENVLSSCSEHRYSALEQLADETGIDLNPN